MKTMRMSRVFLFFCLALAGSLALPDGGASAASRQSRQKADQTQAGSRPATAGARSVPTRVTADGMTYEADAQQVVFTKNVHVTRPDFEMWANKLTVYLKPAKKKETTPENGADSDESGGTAVADSLAAGDIDRIVATGNVRMKRDKNASTSDKATYTMDTAVLVLEGDPRLTDGENVITGDVVRYFMNENRSEVSRGPGKQVEAVFSTSDKPTREGGR